MKLAEWIELYAGSHRLFDQLNAVTTISKLLNIEPEVVGHHTSQMVFLPVFRIGPIICRNNFFDWNLACNGITNYSIGRFLDVDKCFLEGMEEFKEWPYYKTGLGKFIAACTSSTRFVLIVWELLK